MDEFLIKGVLKNNRHVGQHIDGFWGSKIIAEEMKIGKEADSNERILQNTHTS